MVRTHYQLESQTGQGQSILIVYLTESHNTQGQTDVYETPNNWKMIKRLLKNNILIIYQPSAQFLQ
jgi:hypothetical protein